MADLADVRRFCTSALGLTEGNIHCKLDGQASHGSGGQRLNFGHSLDQPGFGAVGLQRHLQFHNSAVSEIEM